MNSGSVLRCWRKLPSTRIAEAPVDAGLWAGICEGLMHWGADNWRRP
jgi:hypothetical protein